MYVVLLKYVAPEREIDAAAMDHFEWVTRHYDNGDFIAAGHRESRTGGVIIARAMARGKLEAILATDPFSLRKLARHEVIEFQAYRTIPELVHYADRLSPASSE